ncbi:MAG TPA: DNA methyltransferase [Hanamia sp.]|nr:DNA methyltransferase [Hanamia sp.]
MPLSWNEIKSRAIAFTNEWKDEESEEAEAKSFWDAFFHVFGIHRRRIASFEHHVKLLNNKDGYIDLFWPGTLIVEHKSKGKSLDKAHGQVLDYFDGIDDKQLPQYILVSDFERFRLYDLDSNAVHEFTIDQFLDHIGLFGFIAGYERRTFREQDPVNIEAAALMGKLHDKLESIGYTGHALELYLVRLLFCLFADDSNIFERGILYDYIDQRTDEDGSDLANHIAQLFEVLNTPKDKRFSNLDESLAAFPYVNGKLFEEHLPIASFDSEMRKLLLNCCALDWGKISPAIFGSLFQSVMDRDERRNLGAHYTSEKNIMKVIKPLFLDELWKEFESVKSNTNKLKKLHEKISNLRFLDPACGCGNFLIIAYRELRLLEMEIIKLLLKNQTVTSIDHYFLLDVDRFYGIEYEEFPAQIAQVAMWLIDHQLNMKASETFGEYYVRLPLRKSAVIKHGNALRIDWQSLIEPLPWEKGEQKFHYIFGNPPFVGKKEQNSGQKKDMEMVFAGVKGAGVLDYVTAWYIKGARYMHEHNRDFDEKDEFTRSAFVSTNSITQGEQVSILWNELFNKYHVKIFFAHRTFRWSNEARGNAAVHVVIIGFANFDINGKTLFEYENIHGEPHEVRARNINPYLVEGNDMLLMNRKNAICSVPEINYGSFALDDGNYTLSEEEKNEIIAHEPIADKYIKPFIGGKELIRNEKRYCLWLLNANPSDLTNMSMVKSRIEAVRKWRANSNRTNTKKLAATPTLFAEIRQPSTSYLAFPTLSSVNRFYIPIAFLEPEVIASNQVYIIANANSHTFGIVTSIMHMSWVKAVCGRFKSDYRYSAGIVYNNFPWPENPTQKQKKTVEDAAQHVLDVRAKFPDSSLTDLYDPNTMPPELVKAHQALDKAVDLCYRPQPFINETKRIEFLFELYDKYTSGMFASGKKKNTKSKIKK